MRRAWHEYATDNSHQRGASGKVFACMRRRRRQVPGVQRWAKHLHQMPVPGHASHTSIFRPFAERIKDAILPTTDVLARSHLEKDQVFHQVAYRLDGLTAQRVIQLSKPPPQTLHRPTSVRHGRPADACTHRGRRTAHHQLPASTGKRSEARRAGAAGASAAEHGATDLQHRYRGGSVLACSRGPAASPLNGCLGL